VKRDGIVPQVYPGTASAATDPYHQRLEAPHKRDTPYFSVILITKGVIGNSPIENGFDWSV
jgi:hypothetical protein